MMLLFIIHLFLERLYSEITRENKRLSREEGKINLKFKKGGACLFQ